jgi:hypothetical protein
MCNTESYVQLYQVDMRAEAGAKFLAAAVGVALCVCIYVDVSDAAAETYAVPLTGTDIRLVSAPAEDLGQLALGV